MNSVPELQLDEIMDSFFGIKVLGESLQIARYYADQALTGYHLLNAGIVRKQRMQLKCCAHLYCI